MEYKIRVTDIEMRVSKDGKRSCNILVFNPICISGYMISRCVGRGSIGDELSLVLVGGIIPRTFKRN